MDLMNSISNIMPNLYLGSVVDARDKSLLMEFNITHIVEVTDYINESAPYSDTFKYHVINAWDDESEDLKKHFDKAHEFITQSIDGENGNVLVHCTAGISRSPTIVIAYIMKQYKYPMDLALKLVSTKRPHICPNFGFKKQLKAYEEEVST